MNSGKVNERNGLPKFCSINPLMSPGGRGQHGLRVGGAFFWLSGYDVNLWGIETNAEQPQAGPGDTQ